jgi:HK97 family phage major capsid protein
MAASNLKRLQDRAAAVAARMNELAGVSERSEEQTAELRKLDTEADTVKADLEFEQRLAAKEKELRSVIEPAAAPAPAATEPEKRKLPAQVASINYRSLTAYNDSPAAVEDAYKVGRWLRASIFRKEEDLRWCSDHGVESRALNEGVNSAGGTLVPDILADRVIRLVETYGTFPPAAESQTMTRDTLIIPKRLTGTSAYFVGEGNSINESEPTYGNVQLIARKLACSCRLSTEVMEDALVNLADQVTTEFSTSLALKIDQCGWLGDGTQTYGGIYGIVPKIDNGSYTASVVTAATGGTTFGSLALNDFLNVMGKVPLYARQGAEWYVSPAGFAASMARLKYSAGGNAVQQIGGDAGLEFLGYKVNLVHVMNTTLTSDPSAVKVIFGNMKLSSILAKRRDFSIKLYDQVYATTDQLLLQGTMRFDINHHSLGSTSEVGPVVALKTAAS